MKTGLMRRWRVAWLASALLATLAFSLSAGCGAAAPPQYPNKPIDVVVTFAAGGASDQTARIVADYLTKKWGQAVNVVNKPGGSGAVGVTAVLPAAPDGYTILLHSFANTALPATQSDAPYKAEDPTPLGLIMSSPSVFTVPADSPWKTLKDAIDAIKKDPESIKYGVGGAASPSVFAAAKLFEGAGIDPTKPKKVIFDGGAPTMAATAGGQVAFATQPIIEAQALIKAGKLRGLAFSSDKRVPAFPDIPTGKELGYPQYDIGTWNGFSGPPKTPDSAQQKWAQGLAEAAKDAEVVKKFEATYSLVDYKSPADFKKFLEDQYNTMKSIAEKQGIRK